MNVDWLHESQIIRDATEKAHGLETPSDVRLFGKTMMMIADILEKKVDVQSEDVRE